MSTPPGVPSPNSSNNARNDECQKMAESLWNQAMQHLSEDDQQLLASLQNDKLDILNAVLDEVETKKQHCLNKRWTYKGRDGKSKFLRDLCDKMIARVTKFKELGDTLVRLDVSGHAAMPWAGVSFLLQASSNESQTFGRMLEGVEHVSFLITRYALVEHAYFSPSGGTDALMDHLSGDEKSSLKGDMVMMYSSILTFLAKASAYYSERIAKSVIDTPESAVDDFLDDITFKENKISRTQHLLHQSSLNLLWEQGADIRLVVKHLCALEDPVNRLTAQMSDIKKKLDGNWLLRNIEFLDWERSRSSSILWVHGMPGCGKSYLLSFFVDHVTEKSPSQRPLTAFFYCSRNKAEPERQDATSIMRCLLKQLCSDSADEPIRDPVATTFKQRKEAATRRGQEVEPFSLEETTSQIIDVLSFRQDPAFIILDALDECSVDSVHDLLDALEQILQEASGLTKAFVTSRDDGNIRNRLEGATNVYIDASNNSDDINRFIVAEVEKDISRGKLLEGRVSKSLKDEIVTTLKNKAGGMFRWVSLQLEHISNSGKFKIPEAVRDELGKLPATLGKSYDVIYTQILDVLSIPPLIFETSYLRVLASVSSSSHPKSHPVLITWAVRTGIVSRLLLGLASENPIAQRSDNSYFGNLALMTLHFEDGRILSSTI
ncbi:uncharacterized protein LTHEOB_4199 [Lasiodiplodia theobromae]|uniref:uncharacterized protein n=1 Tax=Lasiodiplodia theobromae TaxID=45133 RepID=UPI0015C32057|nr:uncharacterized protein LTHEOB_4199 [Lasiodiplodia theobromae]KAF4546202.1 hypothetical protein LTHEOB_4199 [Lasiodiplodia theobromae]